MKKKLNKYALLELASPIIGFVASIVILLIIVVAVGENPGKAMDAVWKMTFAKGSKIATIFSMSIPYYLAGLAVAYAFRANIFNIGVEGQYFFGGMTGALAGMTRVS